MTDEEEFEHIQDRIFELDEGMRTARIDAIRADFSKTLPLGFPTTLIGWSVDEAIECLSFGPARKRVEDVLLRLAPAAHETRAALSTLWPQIDSDVQRVLAKASR